MNRISRSVCAPALTLTALLAPGAHAQSLWVVDAAGGGDFTTISDALAVTHVDWTVLVRPGTYDESIVLDNQACTLIVDDPGTAILTQPIVVENLGPARSVTVSGFELELGLRVQNCTGPVLIQDCSTTAPATHTVQPTPNYWEWDECGIGTARHEVVDCHDVTFVDCAFIGAEQGGTIDPMPGNHALQVESSVVALYGCTLAGADGSSTSYQLFYGFDGSAGGDGVHVEDGASIVRHHRCTLAGGVGGISTGASAGLGNDGCEGEPIRHPNPTNVVPATHSPFSFDAPPVLRGGVTSFLDIEGPAGAPVSMILSDSAFWRAFPAHIGVLHLGNPITALPLGPIEADGTLTRPITMPAPGTSTGFTSLHLQVFAVEGGSRFLSNPQRAVVVDPSL